MSDPVYQRGFSSADLRKHGCVLASLAYVRKWAGNDRTSENRVEEYLEATRVSLADFRKRGIMLGEAARAAALAYPGDRLPPVFRKVVGGKAESDLLPDVLNGAVAVVWVDYGIVQDAGMAPSGVTFRGGHAVCYVAVEGDEVVVADPLRKSLVRWRRSVAVRAAETFGSKKRINALVFKPSLTHTQEIARYRGLMQKARGQRDLLKVENGALRAQLDGTTLTTIRNKVRDVAGRLEDLAEELDEAVA